MCPQIACLRRGIVTLITFVCFSPRCLIKCFLKLTAREDAKSHWLDLFGSNISGNCWDLFINVLRAFSRYVMQCCQWFAPPSWARLDCRHCKSNNCNQWEFACADPSSFSQHLKMHIGKSQTNAIGVTMHPLRDRRRHQNGWIFGTGKFTLVAFVWLAVSAV